MRAPRRQLSHSIDIILLVYIGPERLPMFLARQGSHSVLKKQPHAHRTAASQHIVFVVERLLFFFGGEWIAIGCVDDNG